MVDFEIEFEIETGQTVNGTPEMRRHKYRFREVPTLRPSDTEVASEVRPTHNSRLHMMSSFVFLVIQLSTFYYQIYTYSQLDSKRSRIYFLFKCSLALLFIELLRLLVNIYLTVQILMCYAFT